MNETLADMWRTRPPRIPRQQGGNAQLAGVCEGIGARYQIDPTLVRVIYIALALLAGGGIFIYLVMWFVMPRIGLTTSPGRAIVVPADQLTGAEKHERTLGWELVIGLLLLFPFWSFHTDGHAAAGSLGGLLIAVLTWYGLHQRTPTPPAHIHAPILDGETEATTAPAPQHKQRPKTWVAVAAVVTAAMVGIGVVAYFAMRSTDDSTDDYVMGLGELSVQIDDPAFLPNIRHIAGDVTVDLTQLEPLDDTATLDVGTHFGTLTLLLPERTPTTVTCTTTLSKNVSCPAETINPDGDGKPLIIGVQQFAGAVDVVDYPTAKEEGLVDKRD